MPALTPQAVGVYFPAPLGDWSGPRDKLPLHILRNAVRLASVATSEEHLQLHLELSLHWHCLSGIEKFIVAQAVSLLAEQAPSVRAWLTHMVQGTLPDHLPLDFSASMPIDHMFDYGGFMERTNRVYGALPAATAARHHVCVVGGGPAGIIAADGLNRLNVRVTVLEQAADIGGRLMTVRLPPHDSRGSGGAEAGGGGAGEYSGLAHGEGSSSDSLDWDAAAAAAERPVSPTPMEMGGMRFAPFPGNSFFRLIQLYRLPTEPFPNPGSAGVDTVFLIGNELFDDIRGEAEGTGTADGGRRDHGAACASSVDASAKGSRNLRLMQKVRADYIAAMRPLLDPIMKARAGADTAKLVELCAAAFRRFDHNTFQGGLDDLLRDQGIAWGTDEWDLFGGIGIG
jgi:tryptophan 2-monooxygenase